MAAPTIPVWSPTGATEDPDVIVEFDCADDVGVLQNTLDLALTEPGSVFGAVVLNNGVWQPGYNGTITANGSNGFDVKLTNHDPFVVGTWDALARCEDGVDVTTKTWQFTVVADPPVLADFGPVGVVTELTRIWARITDDWGVDTATLNLVAVPPVGESIPIVTAGVVQAGWTGSVIDQTTTVMIEITGWPDLGNGILYRFDLDVSSVVGMSL